MAVSVDKAVIARYEKFGKKFEILVDPERALDLKSGKNVDIDDVLATREIYEDAKKGLRAGEEDVEKVFGTGDVEKIAVIIIKKGEVQLTAEQRRKILDEKRRLIASIISKESINPQTNAPHTLERILNAMDLAKVNIDINKSAEEQVDDVLRELQRVIPIRFERLELQIKVPAQYSAKCYGVIKEFGKMKREEWLSDGSFLCIIDIPAGIKTDVFNKLNNLTHGDVVIEEKKKGD